MGQGWRRRERSHASHRGRRLSVLALPRYRPHGGQYLRVGEHNGMRRSTARAMFGLAVALAAAGLAWRLDAQIPQSSGDLWRLAGTASVAAWQVLRDGYATSPEALLGIGAALVLPLLSCAGLVTRRLARPRANAPQTDTNLILERRARLVVSPCSRAWLRIDGDATTPGYEICGELMRIGRDADNDLAIADESLEAFHAVIRRLPDAEFMIVDVSGREGVAVNGRRLRHHRLRHGDRIDLGRTGVIFQRALAPPAARHPGATLTLH